MANTRSEQEEAEVDEQAEAEAEDPLLGRRGKRMREEGGDEGGAVRAPMRQAEEAGAEEA